MPQETITINLTGVNCYLIKAGKACMLIDTGFPVRRTFLEKKLKELDCLPENLKLIILTHGDTDHAGNAAYLREVYGTKIAIHNDDVGMVESGDMTWKRKTKPDRMSPIFKIVGRVSPLFINPGKFEVFKPDFTMDESFDVSVYGFEARVIHLPGHSKGSIGVLTANGALFCGDFLYNMAGFNMVDDLNDFNASAKKLKKLNIKTIYPGHGKPISFERFLRKCG